MADESVLTVHKMPWLLSIFLFSSLPLLAESNVNSDFVVQFDALNDAESSAIYSVEGTKLRERRQAINPDFTNPTADNVTSPEEAETTQVPDTTASSSTPSTTTTTTTTPTTSTTTTAAADELTTSPSSTTTSTATPTPIPTDIIEDDHVYYRSQYIQSASLDHYWRDPSTLTHHIALSNSHRTASPIDLSFTFPFYGHDVKKVTIATGGFLYLSDFLHQWLTATQYAAPLMANFDTQLGNDSHIRYLDNGTAFTVSWEQIHLQDDVEAGEFSFQAVLHSSGDVYFIYKKIPVNVSNISTQNHPVKVGLSDAYYIDRMIDENTQRRTIYEYHRVTIATHQVKTGSVVILNPRTTCSIIKDCESCLRIDIGFSCRFCAKLGRCSNGFDRYRQTWVENGCNDQKYKRGCLASHTDRSTRSTSPSTLKSDPLKTRAPTDSMVTTIPHEPDYDSMVTSVLNGQDGDVMVTSVPIGKDGDVMATSVVNGQDGVVMVTSVPNGPDGEALETTVGTGLSYNSVEATVASRKSDDSAETRIPNFNESNPLNTAMLSGPIGKFTSTAQLSSPRANALDTPDPSVLKSVAMETVILVIARERKCNTTGENQLVPNAASCHNFTIPTSSPDPSTGKQSGGSSFPIGGIIAIIIIIVVIVGVVGWFVYAYTHPHSASGLWLIEHRPSNISTQLSKVKFWKRNDGGEKYEVSMQPGSESMA